MSKLLMFLVLMLAVGTVYAQKSPGAKKSKSSWVMKDKAIMVMKINGFPVAAADQVAGKKYVLDYEVTSVVDMPAMRKRMLKRELGKETNYVAMAKGCDFVPGWAVVMGGETWLVSAGACAKTMRGGVVRDLGEGNGVEKILK